MITPGRTVPKHQLSRPLNEYPEIDEEIRRDHARLETLCALERHLVGSPPDPDVLPAMVARALLEVFDRATHVVVLYVHQNGEIEKRFALERGRPGRRVHDFLVSTTIIRRALAEKVSILLPDAYAEFPSAQSVVAANIRCTMCAPLSTGEEVAGILEVYSTREPRCFDEKDRDVLTVFANRAAMAISNARVLELQRQLDLMGELGAFIAHDLRGPLTSIISGLQTVLHRNLIEDSGIEFVEGAIVGGNLINEMAEDLVNVHRMESGELELDLQEVSSTALIEQARRQVRYWAESVGVSLLIPEGQDSIMVRTDPKYASRVLVNLLGNAIKYAAQNQETKSVHVHAHGAGDDLRISVEDSGPGIDPRHAARIFDKWYQVERRRARQQISTGLGLTFCKMIVERLAGDIGVESKPGKGSTFWFTLPRVRNTH